MGMWIGRNRKARVTYGFDDIALVPGAVTINPNEVDTSFQLGSHKIRVPILASAMDGVVDVRFAVEMGKLGGLLCSIWKACRRVTRTPTRCSIRSSTSTRKKRRISCSGIYTRADSGRPHCRARERDQGCRRTVRRQLDSARRRAFGAIAQEAGADIFVVQSTVSTVRHLSSEYKTLDLAAFCKTLQIPVVIGNCVTYNVTLELMQCGMAGVLIGIGPGSACTTRGVLGLGVPQVTATVDCAAARDHHSNKPANTCLSSPMAA